MAFTVPSSCFWGRRRLFRDGELPTACPPVAFQSCCAAPRGDRRHTSGQRRAARRACCELFAVSSPTVTSGLVADRARTGRDRASLPRQERRSLAGMAGFVLLLHVVGWGVLIFAVAPHDYRLGSTGVLGVGRRPDGLHARRPARLRRRPHRLDRQHHPQARRRGQVVGQRGLLVLPRPLLGRLRRQPAAGRGRALGRRRRPGRGLPGRPDARPGRHDRRRLVPGAHRPDEPRRRRRHRQGVPPDAHRRVRRGRARAAPAQPRLPGPPPRAG